MIFAVVLVALSFPVLGKAQLFRWTYSRPMCRQQEACYYEAFGYKFQFCDCPNNANCPIDNDFFARSSQSVQYFFCEEPTMPVCENGDLSTTVTGLSTVVHCTCPDDMIMKEIPIENDSSEDDTVAIKSKDYICKKRRKMIRKSSKISSRRLKSLIRGRNSRGNEAIVPGGRHLRSTNSFREEVFM